MEGRRASNRRRQRVGGKWGRPGELVHVLRLQLRLGLVALQVEREFERDLLAGDAGGDGNR
jgi:hypothetical protein